MDTNNYNFAFFAVYQIQPVAMILILPFHNCSYFMNIPNLINDFDLISSILF